MANSLLRAPARASNRLARFTQTMSRINPTADHRTIRERRSTGDVFLELGETGGIAAAPCGVLGAEKQAREDNVSFSLGFETVMPGLKRATSARMLPDSRMSSRMAGPKRSDFAPGAKTEPKSKVGGSTPMTVTGSLSRVMAWPTMPVSAANCLRQNSIVGCTTGAHLLQLIGEKWRPSIGWTPRVGKKFPTTSKPVTGNELAVAVSLIFVGQKAK